MLAPYTRPDGRRAAIQLLNTAVPFLGVAAGLLYGLESGFQASWLLVLPAAALLVRLFIIQHDCGHGAFFASRRANDILGRAIGVLTLMPYASWRKSHAAHHAGTGNLARRGTGDVSTLTVREYLSRPTWRRIAYRFYRHPLVLLGLGPAYLLLIRYRVPTSNPFRHGDEWLSVLGTNAVALAALGALVAVFGLVALAYLAVSLAAMSAGVWLFFIQHQFEDAYWESPPRWDFHVAAVEGSSFYDLPRVLHWITGSIGFHHIHHLSSRIPNYRLRACFDENPELRSAKRLTLRGSLACARLALWDEERRKLVTFRDARAAAVPA